MVFFLCLFLYIIKIEYFWQFEFEVKIGYNNDYKKRK